ncbi:MAG: iron-sulfur cluster assembly scaffold protein [Candidatus Peribacteraceae bacterium]|nr:iron-sulfur cluster assembly scaffold protein [Candidatus Peribacteraceae bacterium]
MDVFAENILDHFRHPRNKRTPARTDVEHEEANHACGDTLTIYLQMENGRILDIGWEGTGCAISQAAMSLLSEKVTGMDAGAAGQLRKSDILDMLGIPVSARRVKCALLCLHTLKNILRISEGKETQNWLSTVEIGEE